MNISSLVSHGTEGGTFLGGPYRGVVPEIVSAVESAGASELIGYLVGRYNEKLKDTKVPVPLVAGLALKAGAVALDAMSYGRSAVSPHLHALGNAGVNAFFTLDGVARGYAAANQQLAATPKGAALPAGSHKVDHLWGTGVNVGHIPQAPDGQWLDEKGLRHFASK